MSRGYQTDIFLSPSSVHHLCSEFNNNMPDKTSQDTSDVTQLNGEIPEMRVIHSEGKWFALDSQQLDSFRRLEAEGKCAKVKAIAIPPSKVPWNIKKLMKHSTKGKDVANNGQLPDDNESQRDLDQSDEDGDSDSSYITDSDSEYDWSHDEPVSSDVENTGSGSDDNDV